MKKNKELIPKNTPYCHNNKMEACSYWKCRNFHIWDVIPVYQGLREQFDIKTILDIYDVKNKLQLWIKIYKQNRDSGIFCCKYLGIKDTYQGSTLLWNMYKECDEGEDYE